MHSFLHVQQVGYMSSPHHDRAPPAFVENHPLYGTTAMYFLYHAMSPQHGATLTIPGVPRAEVEGAARHARCPCLLHKLLDPRLRIAGIGQWHRSEVEAQAPARQQGLTALKLSACGYHLRGESGGMEGGAEESHRQLRLALNTRDNHVRGARRYCRETGGRGGVSDEIFRNLKLALELRACREQSEKGWKRKGERATGRIRSSWCWH